MARYKRDCRFFTKYKNTGHMVVKCEALVKLFCEGGCRCSFYKPKSDEKTRAK